MCALIARGALCDEPHTVTEQQWKWQLTLSLVCWVVSPSYSSHSGRSASPVVQLHPKPDP